VVFLSRDNHAAKFPVEILGRNGVEMAVRGIGAGEIVVTTGNLIISQGTPLSVTMVKGSAQ